VVVNVGVLTEGWDSPNCEVIIQARPTKSRCLYSQMVGRATRPLPGLVDGIATAHGRRQAIDESAKPAMLVVDFVGNAGKHKLMSSADILGGKLDDEVIESAKKKCEKQARLMSEALDEAQREAEARRLREAARRAQVRARSSYNSQYIDPFSVFEMKPVRARGWDRGRKISEKQRAMLLRNGINPDTIPYGQARQILDELFRRIDRNLASMKQCNLLKKHGYDTKNLSMRDASLLIDELARNHWRRPPDANTKVAAG
jgi:hypothetical protein